MNFTTTVQNWFKNAWGGSLLLPDGWYGRPYDNQHALTSINEERSSLTIILDRKLTLHFEGLKSVEAQKGELVFRKFAKCRFEWESYGADANSGYKEYHAGEVRIVSAPG